MTDSGSAAAATSVARQSRRNHQTTSTASSAPSYSSSIEPRKFSWTGAALSITSVSTTFGMRGLQFGHRGARALGDLDLAGAAGAEDFEADDLAAVLRRPARAARRRCR